MPDYTIHPAATIFPLMGNEEIESLAEDIRENGLRNPIVWDTEHRVLDGRNRLAACERAGVEPQFTEANGADPLALVVSLNVKRRNLTAGQRAIAAAEAMGSDKKLSREKATRLFGVNRTYVDQARALVDRDASAAMVVKRGDLALSEAYEDLRKREGRVNTGTKERERLRRDHPDLADRVDAEELPLTEAVGIASERDEAVRKDRWATTMNVLDGLAQFDRPETQAHAVAARLDEAAAAGRGETITVRRLRNAARFAAALAEEINKEESK